MSLSLQKIRIHMIKAIKNRTREEVIAAFRQSIQRKHEWQEKAEEDIKRIRMERLQLSIWYLMKALDLNLVNRLSPYKVWTEDGRDFFIETTRGQIFLVGFMDDYSIWETGAYQFTINNQSHQPSPNDLKLKDTILLLIEAFFAANPDILLYICETGDGKQAFRSRLFIRWFNTSKNRDAYILETAEVQEGNTKNFAALIVQKSNPRHNEIVSDFKDTIELLANKPEV